ncbi:MAG: MFS transporter [Blautia sp.]
MSNSSKNNLKRMGISMLFANLMLSFITTMAQNYASYSYTDLAGASASMMSTCMFAMSVMMVILSVFAGAIIDSTRSRWGKYRPWLIFANIAGMAGGFLIFFNLGDSILLKAMVISLGYFLANACMDFNSTSKMSLIANVTGGDSGARDLLMGRQMQGIYASMIIGGFIVVPMVNILGQGNETRGFLLAQAVFTVIVMAGAIWLFTITKEYDPDNRSNEKNTVQRVKFGEMVKSVLTNREAIILVLSDISRYAGYYVLMSMMVYQCTYVIGSMSVMSYALAAVNFASFMGALAAAKATNLVKGRKKTVILVSVFAAAGYFCIGIFGQSAVGFIVSASIASFFQAIVNTIDPMLFIDAGEYWMYKTGKDTRTYLLSMQGLSVKLGIALSSLILGAVLTLIHYEPGVALSAAGCISLTWTTALVPCIAFLLPILFLLFHRVSDQEMAEAIKANAEQ